MVGVEIDEIGHKKNISFDEYRTESIKFALNQDDLRNIEVYRIKTYDTTIEILHDEVNRVANIIIEKFKGGEQDWLSLGEQIIMIKKKIL